MDVEFEKIHLEQGLVKVDASILKSVSTVHTVPEFFVKVLFLEAAAPQKIIRDNSFQRCQCKLDSQKESVLYSSVPVDGDWVNISYQDEPEFYEFSFQFKLPRNCWGLVRFKLCAMLTTKSISRADFDSTIELIVVPRPSLYVECCDVSSELNFIICNSFYQDVSIEKVELVLNNQSVELDQDSYRGIGNVVGPDSSVQFFIDVNSLDLNYAQHDENSTNSAALASFQCRVQWSVQQLNLSRSSLYYLPLFESFNLKLILKPRLLSPEPIYVNKPFIVRYQVLNNLGDFKNLVLKWKGEESNFCLNPEENLGGLINKSETECCLEFVPTLPGIFNFGGDSLRLELQFSSNPWTKFHGEEVLKESLMIEVHDR